MSLRLTTPTMQDSLFIHRQRSKVAFPKYDSISPALVISKRLRRIRLLIQSESSSKLTRRLKLHQKLPANRTISVI